MSSSCVRSHRALLPAVVVLGIAASIGACAGGAAPPERPIPAAPAPVPAPAASAVEDAGAFEHVRILAINDFHGHLEPPSGTNGLVLAAPDDPLAASVDAGRTDAGTLLVPTGGAAYLAAHLAALRAENPNTVVVSAGDLTGASPLLSNLFADEPSVLAMNRMGLAIEGVGNHDFDRTFPELMRLAHGGCEPGGCDAGHFEGASYEYLGANVLDTTTGRPALPPYVIRDFGRARVAFIGETLRQTPAVTTARAVHGLSFADEADTANALVPELRAKGASAIVLLLHQGGLQAPGSTYDGCAGFTGDVLPILARLSPDIEVVVSGHTHQAYDCTIDGRLVTSAASYGRLVTAIDLTIDPAAKRIVDKRARNVPVTHDVAPDPDVARIVAGYEQRARPITDRVVGYVARDLVGSAKAAHDPACETPLGDVIADAMRAATGADLAFMNPGGIRADLAVHRPGRPDHTITYGEAFEVQPFQNELVTMTLRGSDLLAILRQQFGSRSEPRILQISSSFRYRYAYDRATRTGAVSDVRVNGAALDPNEDYRVTVPSFLAGGGDAFAVLKTGRDAKEGPVDLDALVTYLGKHGSAAAPFDPSSRARRIEGDGCR